MKNACVVLAAALLVSACDKEAAKPAEAKGAKEEESKKKPLTAPKVKGGKIALAGKCNDKYPIDKEGDAITSCAITEEIVVGDITCAKDGRPVAEADGTLKNCGLKGTLEAGPLKCKHGITIYADGTIKECYLAEPVSSEGKECKKSVSFKADGTLEKCS